MVITTENEHLLKELRGIIYVIRNNINGKCYVGQTINSFARRYSFKTWYKYISNDYFSNAINKYGHENFSIEIVESNMFDSQQLNKKEEEWSLKLNSYVPNGYNIKPCGERVPISLVEEHRKRCSDSSYHSKTFTFKNIKTGEITTVYNLNKFCKENNLCRFALGHACGKLGLSYKGIYCHVNTTEETIEDRLHYSHHPSLKPPFKVYKNKKELIFTGINKFIKEYGLKSTAFIELLIGKRNYYRDFTLKQDTYFPPLSLKKYEWVDLITPDNKIIRIFDIEKFCKEKKLSTTVLYDLIKGNRDNYKNYCLYNKKFIDYYLTREQIQNPSSDNENFLHE